MKIKISRPNIFLIAISTFLLIFVVLFSFLVLIPKGKEYRVQRLDVKKLNSELRQYQDYNDEILSKLKELQKKNRHTITAFENIFNPDRFEKQNKKYFLSLKLSKIQRTKKYEESFDTYEVNTTSKISSPESFYNFLDSINKSDWIISVNFPIHFKRDKDVISSSFTMKVYVVSKDTKKIK